MRLVSQIASRGRGNFLRRQKIIRDRKRTRGSCVRNRKSGVCFASKRNDEEREARSFCDGKNLLVEDSCRQYESSVTESVLAVPASGIESLESTRGFRLSRTATN